jgi:salicylate hydroxylase
MIPNFRETFGAPYYVIHRANFHTALYRRTLDLGVAVKLASRVVEYDVERTGIVLESGDWKEADLIVAADGSWLSGIVWSYVKFAAGVKSVARKLVDKSGPAFERTVFAAYRATVDVARIKADPELSWLLDRPNLNFWYECSRLETPQLRL